MADPEDAAAAAAAAGNEDDVEDLYADLDDQVAAALAAAGESGGSNPATDGEAEAEAPGAHHTEADANEAVDLGDGTAGYISSDEESEDDLHIVLNEDGAAPPPPPPAGRCEEGSEEGEVSGSCVKGLSTDGGRGKVCFTNWRITRRVKFRRNCRQYWKSKVQGKFQNRLSLVCGTAHFFS